MNNSEFKAPSSVPLREYIESLLDALRTEMHLQFTANETALLKAKESTDREMEHLNELRQDFARKSEIFATKESLTALDQRLDLMINQFTSDKGKIYGALAAITIVIAIIQVLITYWK